MKRYLPFAIIAIVLCSAIVVAALLLRAPREQKSAPLTPGVNTNGQPQAGANPPRSKGEDSAPVTMEEFGDLECPPCRAFHYELLRIESEYGTRLRVIFRHFPLTQIHPLAVEAAQAAEAAGEQGKFWEMHDWLYDHQEEWHNNSGARQMFTNAASSLGLNVERFKQDMNSSEVKQRIIQDYRRGVSLGVQGTPTLFVNGRLITQENMTQDGVRAAINNALAAKGQ